MSGSAFFEIRNFPERASGIVTRMTPAKRGGKESQAMGIVPLRPPVAKSVAAKERAASVLSRTAFGGFSCAI
jgi:hypothetical protein